MGGELGLGALAAGQHGLFTRSQAVAVGMTARQLEHGARTGRWERVHRGVYRVAGAPRSELQSLLAAVLAAGPGAVASHRAAAWLWGLSDEMCLEVTSPSRSTTRGVAVHGRAGAVGRAVLRRGVPCTDPLRTVVDLAAVTGAAVVDHAVDRGVAARLFTVRALTGELDRRAVQGRPGVALVRECLRRRSGEKGRPPSVLESRMARLVRGEGLPAPVREHWVPGLRYRLDFAWPEARVAVEVDGYDDHSSWDEFCADRRRQNDVVLAGWTVLRFTWADVCGRPRAVAGAIRTALAGSRPA